MDADITTLIPHRYPFLLVDRLVELEPGKRAVGIKNVSANEWYFQGHFPGEPIMPGVLIVEALAQVGAAVILSQREYQGRIVVFGGLDRVRFKLEVKPGDQLLLQVEIGRWRGRIGKGTGQATVGDKVAAKGEFTFAVKE